MRRIRIALSVLALTVSAVIILSSMKWAPPASNNSMFFPDFPPIGGQEMSLTQAQSLVSFKINTPSNLGNFVQLKINRQYVIIVYSASKPSPDANIFDIIGQNGIVLFETHNNATLQSSEQNIRDAINSTKNDVGGGLQAININGDLGCAGGNIQHTVTWYTETTEYELIANVNYPLTQLIMTANTIPVN